MTTSNKGQMKATSDFALHRHMKGAADPAILSPSIPKEAGLDASGFKFIEVHVRSDGVSQPSWAVAFWNDEVGEWFYDPDTNVAGFNSNIRQFVQVNGCRFIVTVTGGVDPGQEAWVYVAGFNEPRAAAQ